MDYVTLYILMATAWAIILIPTLTNHSRELYGKPKLGAIIVVGALFGCIWPITILVILGKFLKKALD